MKYWKKERKDGMEYGVDEEIPDGATPLTKEEIKFVTDPSAPFADEEEESES